MNTLTGEVYKCVAYDGEEYSWSVIANITQVLGNSETAVMSQKAVTNIAKILGLSQAFFEPVNILADYPLTKTVGAVWTYNGVIASTQYTSGYTAINEKIDVLSGHTYLFKNFAGMLRTFYKDGSVGEQVDLIEYGTSGTKPADFEWVCPEDISQIGIAYLHNTTVNFTELYRTTPTIKEQENLTLTDTSRIVVNQTLGDSEAGVMSQKATTANFDAIREAFEVEGGYLNILDPTNCESGYYNNNLDKITSTAHLRTVNPIPVPSNRIYVQSDVSNGATFVIMELDENKAFLKSENVTLAILSGGNFLMNLSAETAFLHLWVNNIALGHTFDNICISTVAESKFERYNAPPKTKSLKIDMFPDEVKKFKEGYFEPVNILDSFTLEYKKGYFWDTSTTNGLVTTQYTGVYTSTSTLIDVVEGCTYRLPSYAGIVALYDAEGKNGIRIAHPTGTNIADLVFTVPEGKSKAGISFNNVHMTSFTTMYRETPSEGEKTVIHENFSILPQNITARDTLSLLSPLKGKIIVNFGDSIFGNARPPQDVSTRLAELTGATVHNCGFGGCRMTHHPNPNYDAFCMTKLADAITSRNFSLQEKALVNTSDAAVPSYFADGLATLKSIDFTKVCIVTIAYGTNDWNGVPLESADKTSVCGALRYSIETILNKYPHIKIFVCSPTYRYWMDGSGAFTEDSDTKLGGDNYTLVQLIEKIRGVSKEYKIPFIDNYHELGINKFNRNLYISSDGTHHTIEGRHLIAEHIAKCLF